MNGCLTGLVAITAGCATVEPWAAFVIGLFAGWIYLAASSLMIRLKIDDAVDGKFRTLIIKHASLSSTY